MNPQLHLGGSKFGAREGLRAQDLGEAFYLLTPHGSASYMPILPLSSLASLSPQWPLPPNPSSTLQSERFLSCKPVLSLLKTHRWLPTDFRIEPKALSLTFPASYYLNLWAFQLCLASQAPFPSLGSSYTDTLGSQNFCTFCAFTYVVPSIWNSLRLSSEALGFGAGPGPDFSLGPLWRCSKSRVVRRAVWEPETHTGSD